MIPDNPIHANLSYSHASTLGTPKDQLKKSDLRSSLNSQLNKVLRRALDKNEN
jgi:hypothetical protein